MRPRQPVKSGFSADAALHGPPGRHVSAVSAAAARRKRTMPWEESPSTAPAPLLDQNLTTARFRQLPPSQQKEQMPLLQHVCEWS
jgi:hypothetical protein